MAYAEFSPFISPPMKMCRDVNSQQHSAVQRIKKMFYFYLFYFFTQTLFFQLLRPCIDRE